MGLLGKIKDLFTDEEIVDEPIKKEVIKVEIPAPVREERVVVSDSEAVKTPEKSSPVFFDAKDFEDISVVKEVARPVRSSYLKAKKEEEKKIFRPSPIISPVYGVLDKNYRKDDITTKSKVDDIQREQKHLSIDDIRKKAFGTLEEDLENELFSQNTVLFKEEFEEEVFEKELDIFEEMENDDHVVETHEEVSPFEVPFEEQKRERRLSEYPVYDEEFEVSQEPVKIQISDGTNLEDDLRNIFEESNERIEEDLFNLIDSMYEREEDEN